MKYTFKKGERLKSQKIIQRMFDREGETLTAYPLRLVWLETDLNTHFPIQIALSVPKRSFPKAVHRNRLRRCIREAYRLNKHYLYEHLEGQEKQYALMFIYTNREELDYKVIEKGVQKCMRKFVRKIT